MRIKILLPLVLVTCSLFVGNTAQAELGKLSFGIEGGFAAADIGAKETAQTLANLSGSTVTYTYDKSTWMGRMFADLPISELFTAEIGFFLSGDLDAKYTISGASATEAYSMWGFDASLVLKSPEMPVYAKAGLHQSEVSGDASLTIGGTTYAAKASQTGPGWLIGLGYVLDNQVFFSVTHYANVGGIDEADITFVSVGYKF